MSNENNNNNRSDSSSDDDSINSNNIEERIIFTTEDGEEIPAEFESNCLMALEVQRIIEQQEKDREEKINKRKEENKNNNKNHDDDNDDNMDSPTSSTTSKNKNVEDPLTICGDIGLLFKAHEQDIENDKRQQKEDEEQQNDDKNTSGKENHQDGEEEEEEEFDQDDFEGMMYSNSALGMEREETDQSQWKLEEIIKRKSVPVQYDEDEVDEYEDDDPRAVGASVKSKVKSKKEFSYLCKWAPGGRCTTWELRSLLVEEGFGPQVDEYDLKVKEKGITAKAERTEFKGPCEYGKIALRGEGGFAKNKKKIDGLSGPPAHQLFFERLLPNWRRELFNKYKNSYNMSIIRVARCAPRTAADAFIRNFKESNKSELKLLFHGTSSAGVSGILQHGLVVPGNLGVKVANGSAHGICIYSAGAPGTSCGYDRTGMKVMFACVGSKSGCKVVGDFHCYSESVNIVPVFLVQYSHVCSLADKSNTADEELFELCSSPAELLQKAAKEAQSSTSVSTAKDPYAPPPGKKMTTHEKKLLRQKRQQLGLSRISM